MATRNARSLLQYWARPYLADGGRQALPFREWVGWIGVMLVLSLLAFGLAHLALHLQGHVMPQDRGIQALTAHPSWSVAAMLLCAPVLEELIFRAFMTRETKVMALGLGFLLATLGLLVVHALGHTRLVVPRHEARVYFEHAGVLVAVGLLLAGVVYSLRWRLRRGLTAVAPLLIVLATLLFAAIHALNFEQGWKPWLLWLTLPQLMSGLVLVYVRVRHGLRWSIATHLAFDWLLMTAVWSVHAAKSSGVLMHLVLTLSVSLLLAVALYGLVFLFRRGVLRALPEAA